MTPQQDATFSATITPQQNASLEALHQSMQMSDSNNTNNTNENTDNNNNNTTTTTTTTTEPQSNQPPEPSIQQQQQEQLQQQHKQQQQQQQINEKDKGNQEWRPEQQPQQQAGRSTNETEDKPAVGSEEWHRQRRENHKQVERRRRENINEGITEISRIVPGCEKNKGSILNRAAAYIRQLKDTEAATLEKWTLEKLLTDQAINELNRQVEAFKSELERVKLENNYLKRELESITNGDNSLLREVKKRKMDE